VVSPLRRSLELGYGGGEQSRRRRGRQSGRTGQAVMSELLFLVEEADDCFYRAQVVEEAIHTEADTLEDLRREIRDAVQCHFEGVRHRRFCSACTSSDRNCWLCETAERPQQC
jgi:predicted RNase H-like HicB family nuclease